MDAINKKERDSLFWQFVIIFAATVAVFLLVLYFDFSLPGKISETEKLRLEEYRKYSKEQENMADKIFNISFDINQMSSSDLSTSNLKAAQSIIDFKKEFATTDTTSNLSHMVDEVHKLLDRYRDAQKKLLEEKDQKDKLERDLRELKQKFEECKKKAEAQGVYCN
jgi:hypothetical protein